MVVPPTNRLLTTRSVWPLVPSRLTFQSYPEPARPASQAGIGTYVDPGVVSHGPRWWAKLMDTLFASYATPTPYPTPKLISASHNTAD